MEIDFELVLEGISLGLDALILGFLYKSYESCSAYIEALKVRIQTIHIYLFTFSYFRCNCIDAHLLQSNYQVLS